MILSSAVLLPKRETVTGYSAVNPFACGEVRFCHAPVVDAEPRGWRGEMHSVTGTDCVTGMCRVDEGMNINNNINGS